MDQSADLSPEHLTQNATFLERLRQITRVAVAAFNVQGALLAARGEHGIVVLAADGSDSAVMGDDRLYTAVIEGSGGCVISDARADARVADPSVLFFAGEPVRFLGEAVAAVCLVGSAPRVMPYHDVATLQSLARWVESEFELLALDQQRQQLSDELVETRRRSMIDPLTQVWNRRGMDDLIPREIDRAHREGSPAGLMLIDLDRFKSLNDLHGHLMGDQALAEVAGRIRNSIRPQDILARYGGDEFAVFLGKCERCNLLEIADRILGQVRKSPVTSAGFNASVTIGVAAAINGGRHDLESLLSAADEALFEAKKAGRDRRAVRDI